MAYSDRLTRVAAGTAIGFGLLTVIAGGTTLAGAIDMGAVVPIVLWFNFLAGFAYVGAGLLLWFGRRLARPAAIAVLLATAFVFALFVYHALSGGAFEMRTVVAMALRTGFWGGMAWVSGKAQK